MGVLQLSAQWLLSRRNPWTWAASNPVKLRINRLSRARSRGEGLNRPQFDKLTTNGLTYRHMGDYFGYVTGLDGFLWEGANNPDFPDR
ncbi:hypothetical protein [Methylomonas sp. CM2]|uniref:hypothetical protein n=1 Tax=Methylomonas sp. CM2 TaxID=3417647 RepID=UPI003CEAFAC5